MKRAGGTYKINENGERVLIESSAQNKICAEMSVPEKITETTDENTGEVNHVEKSA